MRNPCHSCGNMFKTTDRTETICEDCKKNPKSRSIQREPEVKRMEISQLPESKVNQPRQVPLRNPELSPDLSFQPESKYVEISQSQHIEFLNNTIKLNNTVRVISKARSENPLKPKSFTPPDPNDPDINNPDPKKRTKGKNKRRSVKKLLRRLPYSELRNFFLNGKTSKKSELRDRALASVTYLGCLRISETLRLTKEQFNFEAGLIDDNGNSRPDPRVIITNVVLSKKRNKNIVREQVWLPLTGERAETTDIVVRYVKSLKKPTDKLFEIKPERAYQLIWQLTGGEFIGHSMNPDKPGLFPHALRSFGEHYLLHHWYNKDYVSLANYLKVSPQVLTFYLSDDNIIAS